MTNLREDFYKGVLHSLRLQYRAHMMKLIKASDDMNQREWDHHYREMKKIDSLKEIAEHRIKFS